MGRWDVVGALVVIAFAGALTGLLIGRPDRAAAPSAGSLLDPSAELQLGDEWLGLHLEGARVGYVHLQKSREGEALRYRVDTRFRPLGEAGGEVTLAVDARLDAGLALRSFRFSVAAGPARFGGEGTVDGLRLILHIDTGGERQTRTLELERPPVLRDTLGPKLSREALVPGARFTFQVFDPLSQGDAPVEVEVVGPDTLILMGQEVPATHIRQTLRGQTLDAWINARGEMLRQELGLGLVAIRETEEEARWGLTEARAGRSSADLRALTSVAVAGLPASLEGRAILRLTVGGMDVGAIPTDARQAVEGAVLTVRRLPRRPGLPLPVTTGPHRDPEPLVQSDHPDIRAAARQAIGDATDTALAAERLVRWVHAHVDQGVVAGVPSALEVLRTGEGDCNEHAALFAALARSVGVPARVDVGLVYHEGRFAWHAWNAVAVEGGWLAVDPTWGQIPADVGHLRLVSGGLEAQADLLRLMGRITLTPAR